MGVLIRHDPRAGLNPDPFGWSIAIFFFLMLIPFIIITFLLCSIHPSLSPSASLLKADLSLPLSVLALAWMCFSALYKQRKSCIQQWFNRELRQFFKLLFLKCFFLKWLKMQLVTWSQSPRWHLRLKLQKPKEIQFILIFDGKKKKWWIITLCRRNIDFLIQYKFICSVSVSPHVHAGIVPLTRFIELCETHLGPFLKILTRLFGF